MTQYSTLASLWLAMQERNEFWPLCTDLDSPVYEGFGLLNMKLATAENLKRLFALSDDAEVSCVTWRPR